MIRFRLLAIVAVMSVACSPEPGVNSIELDVFEFGINPSAATYSPGPVEFTTNNTGEFAHTIVITDSAGLVVMASELIQPETSLGITLDLTGGEYQITCRIVTRGEDGTVFDHFERGMTTTING